MKERMKRLFMVMMAMALVLGLVGIANPVSTEAASKMKKADFIKSVVEKITGQKNVSGKKITVKINKSGSVKVYSKTISSKTVKKYKSANGVTSEQAQYIAAAVQLGIVDGDIKDAKKSISYADALAIVARADRIMNRDSFSEADISLVREKRLTGIAKVSPDRQTDVIKGYMLGYYAGKSDGNYTRTRTIKFTSAATKTALTDMVKRLTDKKARYKFDDFWQMLRISTKNRPKQEKYYEYILDDFPNAYYDQEFDFMQQYAPIMPGNKGADFKNAEVKVYNAFWDNLFKYASYESREKWTFDYLKKCLTLGGTMISEIEGLRWDCMYIFPSELKKFVKAFEKQEGIHPGVTKPLDLDRRYRLAEVAEAFTKSVFNVDYRTVSDRSVVGYYESGDPIPYSFSDEYLEDCIKNETIVECDMVAADPSSISFRFAPRCDLAGYSIRVYVHYRVVNDNGKGTDALVYNAGNPFDSIPNKGYLRETKVSKDGLTFEWAGNDGKWRDGYFDVAFRAGVGSQPMTNYSLYRYRNRWTKLLGGMDTDRYASVGDYTYKMSAIRNNNAHYNAAQVRALYPNGVPADYLKDSIQKYKEIEGWEG